MKNPLSYLESPRFADVATEQAFQLQFMASALRNMRAVWAPIIICVCALIARDLISSLPIQKIAVDTWLRVVMVAVTAILLLLSTIPRFQMPTFARFASYLWIVVVFALSIAIASMQSVVSELAFYKATITTIFTLTIVGLFFRQKLKSFLVLAAAFWFVISMIYKPLAQTALNTYLSGHIAILGISILACVMNRIVETSERTAFQVIRQKEIERVNAERISLNKSEFIAALSHDLRQPLTGLIGYLELAERAQLKSPNSQTEPFIQGAQRSAKAIHKNLIRVLDLARFQDAKVPTNIQKIDLSDVFKNIAAIFEAKAFVENIRLKIVIQKNPTLRVSSDPDLLLQILQNFIANSIAYRRTTSARPWVLLTTARVSDSLVRITVADNGIGIAPELIGRIFEPYFQVNNAIKDSSNGVGLGLSFVNRAVTRLKSHRIAVSSNGRTYSKFSLYVPIDRI